MLEISDLAAVEQRIREFLSSQRPELLGATARGYVDRLLAVSVVGLIFGLAKQISGVGAKPNLSYGGISFQESSLWILQAFITLSIFYYGACLIIAAKGDSRKWGAEVSVNSDRLKQLNAHISDEMGRVLANFRDLKAEVTADPNHSMLAGPEDEEGIPIRLHEEVRRADSLISGLSMIAGIVSSSVMEVRRDAKVQFFLLVGFPILLGMLSLGANATSIFWRFFGAP